MNQFSFFKSFSVIIILSSKKGFVPDSVHLSIIVFGFLSQYIQIIKMKGVMKFGGCSAEQTRKENREWLLKVRIA